MSHNNQRIAASAIAAAVFLATAGHFAGIPDLVFVFKPMASLFIATLAFTNWRAQRHPYSLWISIGLMCSLAGDVWLLWPARYFLMGLLSFLGAHIAYLTAFTRSIRFPARPLVWLLYVAIGLGLWFFLRPGLSVSLGAPVAVYIFLLFTMASQAMGRLLILHTIAARLAAIGAIFFIISDTLLALDRFRRPIPASAILVLGAYYLAQWLIASSTCATPEVTPLSMGKIPAVLPSHFS
jgi:uncharacterized membrane protein YhhN